VFSSENLKLTSANLNILEKPKWTSTVINWKAEKDLIKKGTGASDVGKEIALKRTTFFTWFCNNEVETEDETEALDEIGASIRGYLNLDAGVDDEEKL